MMIKEVTALAILATSGIAQDPPPIGNLSEIPVVLTAGGTQNDCELQHVNLGGMSAAPVRSEAPEYGRDRMFPNSALKMAAFSRGVALFPLHWDNHEAKLYLTPEDTEWSFLMFAVQPGTVGENDTYPPSAEKHIYAYQHGARVPEHLRGRVDVVRNGDEMGVTAVQGLDSYAFTRLLGSDTGDEGNLTAYFSLDADSIPENSEYYPSYIYKKTYNGDSWSDIQVYLTAEQLELDAEDQIDAICVDENRGYVLLSVENAGEDKELWGSVLTEVEAVAVRRSGPVYSVANDFFVIDRLGFAIDRDGIVGLCSDDPALPNEFGQLNSGRTADRIRTTAYWDPRENDNQNSFAEEIHFSAHRIYMKTVTGNVDRFQIHARMLASPFDNAAPPPYVIKIATQTATNGPWTLRRTLNYPSFGVRRSTLLDLPKGGTAVRGKITRIRLRVVHTASSQRKRAYIQSFFR